MALGPGSIAFVGFNADGPDNFAFVTLSDFAAGSLIHFTDGRWTGTNFTDEGRFSLTLTEDVAAGTVITVNNAAAFSPTSTHGTVQLDVTGFTMSLGTSNEVLYAYVGDVNAPTAVIAAISNATFAPGVLDGTGLVEGVTAISLASLIASADVAAYNGPRIGPSSFTDFLPVINNPANWLAEDGSGDQSNNGTAPDLPFSTAGFTDDPNAQIISFAPDSLSVSQAEGDSGTTTITFTVQRTGTGGTTGEVSFSGTIATDDMDAVDFGGTLPLTFSGVIPAGADSAELVITVSADTRFELDEAFTLHLEAASNPDAGTVIGAANSAGGTVLNDDTVQFVNFATDSLTVEQAEGNSGTTLFTFVVERSGTAGLVGELDFSGALTAEGNYASDSADFGGVPLPIAFSGTFLDGEATAVVQITVSGDTVFEGANEFVLTLESLFNPSANTALGENVVARATILNDDVAIVHDGETLLDRFTLTGDDRLTVEAGGTIDLLSGNNVPPITIEGPATDVVIDNSGLITNHVATRTMTTRFEPGESANVTIWNRETGVITTGEDSSVLQIEGGRNGQEPLTGVFTINNAGQIVGGFQTVDTNSFFGEFILNNLATGLIEQSDPGGKTIRGGGTINNWGTIRSFIDEDYEGLAIDFRSRSGTVVNNYDGGLIEGANHAVTGETGVTVFNDVGGAMIGRNGSAVNIDNDGDVEDTVFVTNRGAMEGRSAEIDDSDGDAIDVDGLLHLDNYGTIKGLGHEGYHNGEPNVSEGIAIGGGVINNHAGGEIYGYGRGIQVDNSSNENALGTTTIVNAGLIHGDGHRPEGVAPEDLEPFDLRGNEAINLIGTYADSLTNTGTIIGGTSMGGGDDLIVNKGTMTATGGSAANLGAGDDTFEAHAGSTVTGTLDGGEGNDTLKLIGPGVGTLGAVVNVETLDVQGGVWTLQSGGHDTVTVATGAMVASQLRLNDQGVMTVAAGGSVLVTNGSDAIVAEGSASIENAGLIQALGMTGSTAARAIVLNGGTVKNNAGGIFLAQGIAIAATTAVAGVEIVNEGMVQSLSGQALALGDQDDIVTNKGAISGSVDLGAGDDTLNVFTASSVSGPIDGGEGVDTVNLLGTGTGTLGAVSHAENLNVMSGAWSIAASENYSNIEVAGGATVTSTVVVDGSDHLLVEAGGTIANGVKIADATTGAVIDNAGTIAAGSGNSAITQLDDLSTGDITIINRESGVIRADGGSGTIALSSEDIVGADSKFLLDNAGLIENTNGVAIRLTDLRFDSIVIHNRETGEIIGRTPGSDVIRAAEGIHAVDDYVGNPDLVKIFNDGVIKHQPDTELARGGDAIDFASGGGTVVNSETGQIEGSRHGITANRAVIVENDGTIVGRNGSAVNIDNDDSEAQRVYVINHGTLQGRSATYDDSDGDAIDTDGLLTLDNFGTIEGLGHNGYHNGEPNVSEGLAIGGGIINNYAGGTIYGIGRAIQVDDSENGEAFGATTITNAGLIQGDGQLPTGVTPEEVALFAERIQGGEAINIVGNLADTLTNSGTIIGGVKMDGGNDVLTNSGTMTAIGGSAINLGAGDDTLNVHVGSVITGAVLGGDGTDTVNLLGTGTGALDVTSGFENLVVQSGTWSVAGRAEAFSDVVIKNGATVTSDIRMENTDVSTDESLIIEQGGTLQGSFTILNGFVNAVDSVVFDNFGTVDRIAYGQAVNVSLESPEAIVTLRNHEGAVIKAGETGSGGVVYVAGDEGTQVVFDNAGLIEGPGRVFQANDFDGSTFVLNNSATGVIRSLGDGETLRGRITEVNNAGRIEGGSEGFDYRSNNVTFNNLDGGYIDGLHHAVTGKEAATITNGVGAVMIGHNGSAVNVDNGGAVEDTVHVTNRGTMEGRSAETEDSDGDAIDVDGLLELDNYGVIKGLGAEGYHNGEPNVSEGIAIGGGTIRNHAGGEIHGYGRGIQVDNSSNANALGATTIINAGLIQGDGHGPEGVDPEDAALFDLRGNEAINLVGTYADSLTNSGTIIGGVSMGGGDDVLESSGTMTATGGSAINMGAGDDTVTLLNGSVVTGLILLGDGEDRFTGANGAETVDGGVGDDLIQGGGGDDYLDGGADDDLIFGDGGHDTLIGGLGADTLKGNAGDDTFVVTNMADGRDNYDGGAGSDTLDFSALSQALNLTLRDGVATAFGGDKIENVENIIGGSGDDKLTGSALDNVFTGNAGNDTLKGMAGDDTLDGGEGNDTLVGGLGNDLLLGGAGDDVLQGASGDDVIEGGTGADTLFGGAGADHFVFNSVGDGVDTITDFKTSGSGIDQLVLSASLFENFSGDDAFDLIGGGYLRTVTGGGSTQVQVDVDGGGDSFVTLAVLNGTFSNGALADHVLIQV